MLEPEAKVESLGHFILIALSWIAVAFLPAVVVAAVIGISRGELPQGGRDFLTQAAILTTYAILLLCAYIQGRRIGNGNARAGLGDAPISNLPVIVLAGFLVAIFYLGVNAALYLGHPEALASALNEPANFWGWSYREFEGIFLGPVTQELLFRGWLWTGLRRYWGSLPIAVLTSGIWLAFLVIGADASLLLLLPMAAVLGIARHIGRSVRAPIVLNIEFNLILDLSPWILKLAGFS